MKRQGEEDAGRSEPYKKQKHEHSHRKHHHSDGHSSFQLPQVNTNHQIRDKLQQKSATSYEDALTQLPPPTSKSGPIPAYTHFTVATKLPPLPAIQQESLASAPFTHKSTISYNRAVSSTPDITYERLEFVGDAYIELIASRLIFERFLHLPAGQQSQLRELLVKNETLAEYSRAYGFEERVQAGRMDVTHEDARYKGNKGFNKVLGDVFEAYVAAVILADVEDGFAVAEKWLTALWAPKLVGAMRKDRSYGPPPESLLTHDEHAVDLSKVYSPTAKQELQKRILGSSDIRLSYETYKDSIELKGDQLGQNRHFIALYLTGYGYERKLLGKGEGKNKVEAGNWAATEAMHGKCKDIVEECEKKLQVMKEERKKALKSG